MIITVANQKGGTGKSSVSQAFALYFQKYHKKSVLLIDSDPQKTSSEWAEIRSELDVVEQILPCACLTGIISKQLIEFKSKYDVIIVDCGGHDSKSMRSALSVSNIALIPFRPKRRDLKVALHMSDVLADAQSQNMELEVYSLLTQCPTLPSQYKRIEKAKGILVANNLNPLNSTLRYLNSWDDCDELGLTVFEYEDKKSKDDAMSVFEEIIKKSNSNVIDLDKAKKG